MLTEIEIKTIVRKAFEEIENDAAELMGGKKHRHLSKAFVARIGTHFKNKFATAYSETRFQDYKDGKGIKGEWLLDIVVVNMRKTDYKQVPYPDEIEVAIESEFAPGQKAFIDDFSKLLHIKATNKIYINGIKSSNKEKYIAERMALIRELFVNRSDQSDYTICFVDHPYGWEKGKDPFVQIEKISG